MDNTSTSEFALFAYRLQVASFKCTHCHWAWKTSMLFEEFRHRVHMERRKLAPVLTVGIAPLWDLEITISNDELKLVPACHECIARKGRFTSNRSTYRSASEASFRATVAARTEQEIKPVGVRIASTRKDLHQPSVRKVTETSIDELF